MDLIQLNQKYGKRATDELLNVILIKPNHFDWRLFLIKHGIIKQSTKQIRVSYNQSHPIHQFNKEINQYERLDGYLLRILNGRKEDVLYLNFPMTQIEEVQRGE